MKGKWLIWLLLPAACAVTGGCNGGSTEWNTEGGFSIQLYRFVGPDHVQQATKARDAGEKLARWSDLFIVRDKTSSTVYRGRYSSRSAALRELGPCQRWRTPANNVPFQFAYVVPYPGADPGNPQWDLKEVKGDYTVLVEVYFNDKRTKMRNRKRIASQRCEELRARGEQAYYYHGPANSLVTIGLFDDSAVKVRREGMKGGTKEVIEIVSKEMVGVLKRRPYLYRNGKRTEIGVANIMTGKSQWIDRPSYPVRLPGRGGWGRDWTSGFGAEPLR